MKTGKVQRHLSVWIRGRTIFKNYDVIDGCFISI